VPFPIQAVVLGAIASAGKSVHDNPQRAAKMTSTHPEQQRCPPFDLIHLTEVGARLYFTPAALECRTSIIHDFLIFSAQSRPAAVFSLTMSLLPFFRLTVSSLSLLVAFALCIPSALITTVSLSPPTTLAETKNLTTPTAPNFPQQDNAIVLDNCCSGLANNRKMW
jgi:hypothetical protein